MRGLGVPFLTPDGGGADVRRLADWCYNRLGSTANSARVVAAVDGIRGHYSDGSECLFAFERVLPPPSGVADRGAWCFDNWGTERSSLERRTP